MAFIFTCGVFDVRSQSRGINIDSLWSTDILLQAFSEDFFDTKSSPDHIDSNHKSKVTFCTTTGECIDTTFYYNLLYYFDEGLAYAENDGKIILVSIKLYKNETKTIHTDKIVLNRETSVKDIVAVFHLKPKDVLKERIKIEEYDSPCFYCVSLSFGYSPIDMRLIFDSKKKLLSIYLLPVY